MADPTCICCCRPKSEHVRKQCPETAYFIENVAALSQTLPAPGEVELPEGMTPWSGGDRAPNDWDGGPVLARSGRMMPNVASWTHPWRKAWPTGRVVGENETDSDVVAYTPTLATVAAGDDEGVARIIAQEAVDIITDLNGPLAAQSGTNCRVVEDHLHQFVRALAIGGNCSSVTRSRQPVIHPEPPTGDSK